MNLEIKIVGLEGVEDALAEAGPKLAKRALREGLKAGAEVFIEAAKANAPVLKEGTPQRYPGELRDSIIEKTVLSSSAGSGEAIVGPEYKKQDGEQSPGVWGRFVEFGSIHGDAQPYMRPAFDSEKDRALDAFAAKMREGVEELKA